jgi:hypothetical protein
MNSVFSPTEQEQVLQQLDRIQIRLLQQEGQTEDAKNQIITAINEVRDAATRLGKKDWILFTSGQLLSLALTLGLDGEKTRRIFEIVSEGLRGLPAFLP